MYRNWNYSGPDSPDLDNYRSNLDALVKEHTSVDTQVIR